MKKTKMFYGARPWTFNRARQLRDDLTVSEILLWEYLKDRPCGFKFRRQHPIAGFIVDFFCFKAKLVIEVDGLIHKEPSIQKYDEARQKILIRHGLSVIRFTNKEVETDLDEVKKKIESILTHPKPL